jgi:hypothetical protein
VALVINSNFLSHTNSAMLKMAWINYSNHTLLCPKYMKKKKTEGRFMPGDRNDSFHLNLLHSNTNYYPNN